jgi:alkanesulfonate monooxygenase SsuD/methylene tetrahydromethanopterin reductase-like flavin-dependent oxidoreductase (luciferase family)
VVAFDGRFDKVDRATLNPRPKRRIPIWMGGFSDVAMQRAARIADGYIFADGAADSFDLLPRLRAFLDQEGRAAEPFGLQINMLLAKSPEAVLETIGRWRDAGGTHAAVVTMGQGFTTIDQHVGYIERIAEALRKEGLLPA